MFHQNCPHLREKSGQTPSPASVLINMKIAITTLMVGSLLVSIPATAQNGGEKAQKDIIKSTHTITGKLVAFEIGDYVHAIIKDSKGNERSMFVGGGGVEYFLAIHANKNMKIIYQVVDTYIPEAGGRDIVDRVAYAKLGKLDSRTWWKNELKKSTYDKLSEKYYPLVDKLTRN